MKLSIFISTLTILIIILDVLFLFLFYCIWNNKLKNQLKTIKKTLIINKEFWNNIPNDLLYCLLKRLENTSDEDLENTKLIIKTLKNSLDESCLLADQLVENINKLSFLYLKKSLKKILNSKNSTISTSNLMIKNIQNNLILLEHKNKELIKQQKESELLNSYHFNNSESLYDFLIKKEAINFIYFSIDVYLKGNDFQAYKPLFKVEVQKLVNMINDPNIHNNINKYVSFLNKGIDEDKFNLLTKNINEPSLNSSEISSFLLNRSLSLIYFFLNSRNSLTDEIQDLFLKSQQYKNKFGATNYFWTNFNNKIKKL